MFAPKEAHEDRYIITVSIAVIAIVTMFVMLHMSFYNGLRYALVKIESVNQTGVVTQVIKGGEQDYLFEYIARFRYMDPEGNTHYGQKFTRSDISDWKEGDALISIVYNPNFPQYYMFPEDLEDFEVDIWMSMGFIAIMVVAMIAALFAAIKYVKFKKRMRYY